MKKLGFLLLVTVLLPTMALAQNSTSTMETLPTTLRGGVNDVKGLMDGIANWMFTIFLALAVIFIVLAAYKYLISGGGDGVKDAHKMLIYAAVAIAIAVLAKGLIAVIRTLVGVSAS